MIEKIFFKFMFAMQLDILNFHEGILGDIPIDGSNTCCPASMEVVLVVKLIKFLWLLFN